MGMGGDQRFRIIKARTRQLANETGSNQTITIPVVRGEREDEQGGSLLGTSAIRGWPVCLEDYKFS